MKHWLLVAYLVLSCNAALNHIVMTATQINTAYDRLQLQINTERKHSRSCKIGSLYCLKPDSDLFFDILHRHKVEKYIIHVYHDN